MLIGEVFEPIPVSIAAEHMANHAADQVRDIWLEKTSAGADQWEYPFSEKAEDVNFLRLESFPGLAGIDYIFRWWGATDPEELAGDLEVLWKVQLGSGVNMFKTTLRFATRDFSIGASLSESKKREAFRAEFATAFLKWHQLYMKTLFPDS